MDDVYLVSLRLQAELFWSVFDPLHGLWGAQCQERSSQRGLCSYTVHWQESESRVWRLGSCGRGTDFLFRVFRGFRVFEAGIDHARHIVFGT